jgi:hypothetical protein
VSESVVISQSFGPAKMKPSLVSIGTFWLISFARGANLSRRIVSGFPVPSSPFIPWYDLIWGQCSESLRSRLRGHDGFTTYSTSADSLALLKRFLQQTIPSALTAQDNARVLPLDTRQASHQPRILRRVQFDGEHSRGKRRYYRRTSFRHHRNPYSLSCKHRRPNSNRACSFR